MSSEESNSFQYFSDFKSIFNHKTDVELFSYNLTNSSILNLDVNNRIYLIFSHSMKIISYLKNGFNE